MAFFHGPQRYEPAYGGWRTHNMLDGDKVEIDLGTFKLLDGNIYLFYNGYWGNMLKHSNKKLATPPEQALVAQADEAYRKILEK